MTASPRWPGADRARGWQRWLASDMRRCSSTPTRSPSSSRSSPRTFDNSPHPLFPMGRGGDVEAPEEFVPARKIGPEPIRVDEELLAADREKLGVVARRVGIEGKAGVPGVGLRRIGVDVARDLAFDEVDLGAKAFVGVLH